MDPLKLKLNDLALPPFLRQKLEERRLAAAAAPATAAVVRQPRKSKAPSPELVSAGEHCRQWLDHWADDMRGLRPKVQVARYLSDLAAASDHVFLVSGWNAVVAPVFGVSREAIRQAKNAWQSEQQVAGDTDQGVAA